MAENKKKILKEMPRPTRKKLTLIKNHLVKCHKKNSMK